MKPAQKFVAPLALIATSHIRCRSSSRLKSFLFPRPLSPWRALRGVPPRLRRLQVPGGLPAVSAKAASISASRLEKRLQISSDIPSISKSPVRAVANPIPERLQVAGQLVVVDILCEFPRQQQFVILKRLPAIFDGIKSRVENNVNAVCRCGSKGRGTCRGGELRGDEIPGEPLASHATNANTGCRKRLEFFQRCLHRPRMSLENPLVIAEETHEGNRLRW